jgi:hypothetical protein
MAFRDTQNPGIGGLDELTLAEEQAIQVIAALGTAGQVLKTNATADGVEWGDGGSGAGDVTGPASSVADNIATFDGITGEVIKDGGSTIAQVLNADNHTNGTTNKVYTATEQTKLSNIEASADVTDAVNVGSSIHGATTKTTPIDADTVPLIDSAASNVLKKVTWANIKATLKTYFDTLYNKYVHPNHSGDVTSSGDGATTITSSAITGKTAVTALGEDYVLISDTSDTGKLKKALVSDFGGGSEETLTANVSVTYNADGTVNTVTDTTANPDIVYTMTYSNGVLSSYSDATNTWTINYTSGIITGITKS